MNILMSFYKSSEDIDYVFKHLSNLSLINIICNELIIFVYGFDRCDDKGFSLILKEHELNDDFTYTKNLICLLMYFLCFRILTIVCLTVKANSYSVFNRRISYKK